MKRLFLLQLLMNALFGALLLIAGILAGLAPWSEGAYDALIELCKQELWAMPLLGIALAILGLRLFIWAFSLMRHGSYVLVGGKLRLSVDEGIVQKYFTDYLKKRFPEEEFSTHVVIKNNQLSLMARIPRMCSAEEILEIEEELRMRLQDLIGYTADFNLSLVKK